VKVWRTLSSVVFAAPYMSSRAEKIVRDADDLSQSRDLLLACSVYGAGAQQVPPLAS
jgi:hypothetical protein